MPMATKLGRMLTYFNGLLPTKSDVLSSCGRVWSRDKLESLYLCYQSVYGHETWQDGNLPWGASFHNVTPSFVCVFLRRQVT